MDQDSDKLKILQCDSVYKGYCEVVNYRVQTLLFDGSMSGVYCREIVKRKNAVAALAYDAALKKVVLVEQFRLGALCWSGCKSQMPAGANPSYDEIESPWLLELIAGVLDHDGEALSDAVKRELLEESGLVPIKLEIIAHYLVSPGSSSEEMTIFLAEVDSTQALRFAGLATEQEDIKVHVIDIDRVFAALSAGSIANASSIIALQWLRHRLQAS